MAYTDDLKSMRVSHEMLGLIAGIDEFKGKQIHDAILCGKICELKNQK